jgi:hypothetical protein
MAGLSHARTRALIKEKVMSVVHTSSSVMLRSPGALAAAIPSLVGFHPTDSLVAAFLAGGTVVVTMRLDIPAELAEVAEYVASTGVKVKADEVIVVLCCPKLDDALPHGAGVDAVIAACEAEDLFVRDVLLIDQGRFWSYMCQNDACCPPEGTPIPANELLEAERVGQGLLASAESREDLAGRYAPRPELAPRDAAAEAGARILEVPVADRAERVWDAVRMLARRGAEDTDVDGILRTRVSIAVQDVRVRDYVLGRMAEADAPQPLLEALVRVALTAPEAEREPVAAMAAAALAALGESTVAVRCLLDLAGDQSLGQLVAACIQVPVPPTELRRLLVEAMPQVLEQLARAKATNATLDAQQAVAVAEDESTE